MPLSKLHSKLSTLDILERATTTAQSHTRGRPLTLADIREVWVSTCNHIGTILDRGFLESERRRCGVQVEHFGVFVRRENRIVLQLSKRFLSVTGGRQLQVVNTRGVAVKKLTFSAVSGDCKFNKELCRRVVSAVVQVMYEAVSLHADWVELCFPGLGIFECKKGTCHFFQAQKQKEQQVWEEEEKQILYGDDASVTSSCSSSREEKESTFTDLEGLGDERVGEEGLEEEEVGQKEEFPPSLQRLKEKIKQRGGLHGIHAIGRSLRIMDDSGDGKLSLAEFKYGLKDFGVRLNPAELDELFYFFDKDKSGSISFDEFLIGLRGSINNRRKALIAMAYKVLDRNGDGSVTLEDMELSYDTRMHPEVISGAKTKAQVLREFLSQFDTIEKDGKVSQKEFEEYYKNVSASIDDDDYFELMIRNAWHISGGKGQYENTTNKRVLVTDSSGNQQVKEVKDDIWIDSTDVNAVTQALAKQGVTSSKPIGLHYSNASSKNSRTPAEAFKRNPSLSAKKDHSGDPMAKLVAAYTKAKLTPEDFLQLLGGNRVFGGTKLQQHAFASGLTSWNTSFSKEDAKKIAETLDKDADGEVDLDELCAFLRGASVLKRVKRKVNVEGKMFQLCNVLCRMDKSGDNLLDRNELRDGFTALGLTFNSADMEALFNHFDKDNNGKVSISELLQGLSNPLNKRRLQLVAKVFKKLSGGEATVKLDALGAAVLAESFVGSSMKSREAHENFLHILRTLGGLDKVVKQETFEEFYQFIASPVRFDEDFEKLLLSSWEVDHPALQTRRVLVTHRDGRQTVEHVTKKDFLKQKYRPSEQEDQNERKRMAREQKKKRDKAERLARKMKDQLNMRNRYQHKSWGGSKDLQEDEDPAEAFPEDDWTRAFTNGDEEVPEMEANRDELTKAGQKPKSNAQATEPKVLTALRGRIIERGGANGIHTFGRVLKLMDDSGDKCLSKEELEYGLKDYGVGCTKAEVGLLFNHLDTDSSGKISFDEFLIGLRGPIPKRRVELILVAFKRLDVTGDGVVTMEDIEQVYDASFHPDVQSGKLSAAEGLREFLSQFDSIESDGVVTEEEFIQYYKNVSASIDDDNYFELMMRNAWHISGGQGQCANTTNRRVLVTHKDGRQSVEEVENDLWIDRTNSEEIQRRLRSKGINPVGEVGFFHASEASKNRGRNSRRSGNESTINLGWEEDVEGKQRMQRSWQKERKIRGGAATQVQSLARAHRARKCAQRMKKQSKWQNTLENQEREELEKRKNRIIRPKGKNWY